MVFYIGLRPSVDLILHHAFTDMSRTKSMTTSENGKFGNPIFIRDGKVEQISLHNVPHSEKRNLDHMLY